MYYMWIKAPLKIWKMYTEMKVSPKCHHYVLPLKCSKQHLADFENTCRYPPPLQKKKKKKKKKRKKKTKEKTTKENKRKKKKKKKKKKNEKTTPR